MIRTWKYNTIIGECEYCHKPIHKTESLGGWVLVSTTETFWARCTKSPNAQHKPKETS